MRVGPSLDTDTKWVTQEGVPRSALDVPISSTTFTSRPEGGTKGSGGKDVTSPGSTWPTEGPDPESLGHYSSSGVGRGREWS